MIKDNIALIGFMGTGKTSIGQLLAKELEYEFIDLDIYIEKNEGISIRDIFNIYGESKFREMETKALKEVLGKENQIISTGGGTVIREENRKLLMDNCFVVSLHALPRNIYFRVKDSMERPLLNTPHPLKSIRRLLHKRYKYYRVCHYSIKTDNRTIDSIAKDIIERFNIVVRCKF